MEENVANNKENNEKPYQLGGITGKGFMPGVSGNPSGRPKGTLKDYVRRKFMEMSDQEKEEWLTEQKISGIDQWKMGEGQPKQETEVDATITGPSAIKLDE
jgi:hypothetical protein